MISAKAETLPVYSQGDIVLAKIDEKIPWPATILNFRGYKLNPDLAENQEYYRVVFFGQRAWANLYNYQITPLTFARIEALKKRQRTNRKFIPDLLSAEVELKRQEGLLGGEMLERFNKIYKNEQPIMQEYFDSDKALVERIKSEREKALKNYGRAMSAVPPEIKRKCKLKKCSKTTNLEFSYFCETKGNNLVIFTSYNGIINCYTEEFDPLSIKASNMNHVTINMDNNAFIQYNEEEPNKMDQLNSTQSDISNTDYRKDIAMDIEQDANPIQNESTIKLATVQVTLDPITTQTTYISIPDVIQEEDQAKNELIQAAKVQLVSNDLTHFSFGKSKPKAKTQQCSQKPEEALRIKLRSIINYIKYSFKAPTNTEAKEFMQTFDFKLAVIQVETLLELLVSTENLSNKRLEMFHTDLSDFFGLFREWELKRLVKDLELQRHLIQGLQIVRLTKLLYDSLGKVITSISRKIQTMKGTKSDKNSLDLLRTSMKINFQKFITTLAFLEQILKQ